MIEIKKTCNRCRNHIKLNKAALADELQQTVDELKEGGKGLASFHLCKWREAHIAEEYNQTKSVKPPEPQPKFKVGDKVTATFEGMTFRAKVASHVPMVVGGGGFDYRLEEESGHLSWAREDQLTAIDRAPEPEFRVGQRVRTSGGDEVTLFGVSSSHPGDTIWEGKLDNGQVRRYLESGFTLRPPREAANA